MFVRTEIDSDLICGFGKGESRQFSIFKNHIISCYICSISRKIIPNCFRAFKMPSNDNVQTISRSLIFLFRLVVYKALNFSGDEVQPHPNYKES